MFNFKTISTTKYVGIVGIFYIFLIFASSYAQAANSVAPLTEEQLHFKFGDAVSAYRKTCDNVNRFYIWTIAGEVTQRGQGSTTLWGIAMPASGKAQPPASHPGWMRGKGNIIIKSPNQDGFAYNTYSGDHYYSGETTGKNAYGGVVTVKVFGPLPKEYWQAIAARNTAINQVQAAQDALVSQLQQTWDSKVKANPIDGKIFEEYSTKCMELCKFIHERGFEAHDLANDAVVLKAKAIIAFLNAGEVNQGTILTEQIILMTEPIVNIVGRPDYQLQKEINQSLYTDRSEVSTDSSTVSDQENVKVSELPMRVFSKYPQLLQMIAIAYEKSLPQYFINEKDSVKVQVIRTIVTQFCDILSNDDDPIKKQIGVIIATNERLANLKKKEMINKIDNAEMLFIPAGDFLMGGSTDDDKQQHNIYLDSYYIYKTRVTVEQFRNFCKATGKKMPTEPEWGWEEDNPIVNVTWDDAKAYANWAGAQLPSEAQWEKAVRGVDGRINLLWNKRDKMNRKTDIDDKTHPVVSSSVETSPYGMTDITGNTWEWCTDWYSDDYYKIAPAKNPTGPASGYSHVLRGSSMDDNDSTDFNTTMRHHCNPSGWYDFIGFRCVFRQPGAVEPTIEMPKVDPLTLETTVIPTSPDIKVNPKDGAEMILIPAGKFLMGSTSDDKLANKTEQPQHWVYLNSYYIYKTEVTVAQYRKFCKSIKRDMPEEPIWQWQETHPIVNITWNDAKAYANWAGVQLPSEAQWEMAARGTDGRIYPWGNEWDETKCANNSNTGQRTTTKGPHPVGSFPLGASPYGVMDMAGNVWEWCDDWYADNYYRISPEKNPTGPKTGKYRVLRGCSWYCNKKGIHNVDDYGYGYDYYRSAFRDCNKPSFNGDPYDNGDFDVGFRCALLVK